MNPFQKMNLYKRRKCSFKIKNFSVILSVRIKLQNESSKVKD